MMCNISLVKKIVTKYYRVQQKCNPLKFFANISVILRNDYTFARGGSVNSGLHCIHSFPRYLQNTIGDCIFMPHPVVN